MIDIIALEDAHVVVFKDFRRNLSLLERKVGTPLNPSGRDLWVFCGDVDTASRIARYGRQGINEYVTSLRAPTYERHIRLIPPDVAIMFSAGATNDDALMRSQHDLPAQISARFVWRKGTYYLEAETHKHGEYVSMTSRIAKGDTEPGAFHDLVNSAARRLARRAPRPFQEADGERLISKATALLLDRLTWPAATALRGWLENDGRETRFHISSSSLADDVRDGVKAVILEYGEPRIRSAIHYRDGSVLTDLGIDIATPLPETVAHAAIGIEICRIFDAVGIGSWKIRETRIKDSGVFFGMEIPSEVMASPGGLPPLADADARNALAAILTRDLYDCPDIAPILEARSACRPSRLTCSPQNLYILSALPTEVVSYALGELLENHGSARVSLEPWLGEEAFLERSVDQIKLSGPSRPVDMSKSLLMPKES